MSITLATLERCHKRVVVPNKFNTAIDNDAAIEKLIGFIKEIGHFPVYREFLVKANQDPMFPSDSVFAKFGGKQKLAVVVVNYCRMRGPWDDVVEICTEARLAKTIPTSTENNDN